MLYPSINVIRTKADSRYTIVIMEFGFTLQKAVSLMTVCALIGLVGSYGFGFIDQKMGVKTAVRGYLVWYIAALLINVTMNNATGGYICVAMIGIAIGAAANFMVAPPVKRLPSLTIS